MKRKVFEIFVNIGMLKTNVNRFTVKLTKLKTSDIASAIDQIKINHLMEENIRLKKIDKYTKYKYSLLPAGGRSGVEGNAIT